MVFRKSKKKNRLNEISKVNPIKEKLTQQNEKKQKKKN